MELRDQYVAKLEAFVKYLLKYTETSIRIENYKSELSNLKSRLEKDSESDIPKYPTSDRDFTMTEKEPEADKGAEEIFNKFCTLMNKDYGDYVIRDRKGFMKAIDNFAHQSLRYNKESFLKDFGKWFLEVGDITITDKHINDYLSGR